LECNRRKGSDFASFDPVTDLITPLFNPRRQNWEEHFQLEDARIIPFSAEGRVTVFVLRLNDPIRVRVRYALIKAGRYPESLVDE
jgi:hypothetical protein